MLAPGMWVTDVVNKRKSPIFCFLGQEYERYMGWKKTEIFYFLIPSSTAFSKTSFVQGFLKIQYEVDTDPPVP